jgi:hypothetical protein
MEYQDGKSVKYGDIISIITRDNKFITVEEDEITIAFKDYENDGLKQKILVCGNGKLNNEFYLTFKYSKGFLNYDNNILKSGLPWTKRTVFNIELLKKAIGIEDILILKKNNEEN